MKAKKQRQAGAVDVKEARIDSEGTNGILTGQDRNSGSSVFGGRTPTNWGDDTAQEYELILGAESYLLTTASESTTGRVRRASDAPSLDVLCTQYSRPPLSDLEDAGIRSFGGRCSVEKNKPIRRKSVGSGSRPSRHDFDGNQRGNTGQSKEANIGLLGYPGDDSRGGGRQAFIDFSDEALVEKLKQQDCVAFMNAFLRFKHDCEIVYRSKPHLSPQHPNHLRVWRAKNLWCGKCTESCALCGTSCCAHSEALRTFFSVESSIYEKKRAQRGLAAIQVWNTVGKDDTTFLTCTECYCMVCPNCCGICPHSICRDITCKKCKPNPWALCDWHDH